MPLPPDVVGILERAAAALGLNDTRSPDTLEACAAYYAMQHAGLDAGDAAAALEKVSTGGPDDARLDAIAIIVNGSIITPDHDIGYLRGALDAGKEVNVTIVCVQATGIDPAATMAPSLTQKITGFATGVETFLFASGSAKGLNDHVRDWIDLKNRLFALFDEYSIENNCALKVYLVWPYPIRLHDPHITDIDTFKTIVFRGVRNRLSAPPEFKLVNDAGLVRIEQELRRRMQFQIDSRYLCPGPEVPGKARVYSGFIPAPAFINLISAEDEGGGRKIHRKLFYDNVRSYLGEGGGVNADIRGTLLDAGARDEFHLRSNGVAIAATSSSAANGSLVFDGVQIVNGCQTSYTVFRVMQQHPDEDWSAVRIPVRVAVASDSDTVDEMILGLNRQAAVNDIQIFSRQDFVIRLQQFILTRCRKNPGNRIWFERRAGEYSYIEKQEGRVLSMKDMMTAYSAAFMSKPHLDQTPAELVAAIKSGRLFAELHDPEFYFLAGVMTMHLRQHFNAETPPQSWAGYGAKPQAIYCARLLADRAAGVPCPAARSGQAARTYLEALGTVVFDKEKMQALCAKAKAIVDAAADFAEDGKGALLTGTLSRKAGLAPFTDYVAGLAVK